MKKLLLLLLFIPIMSIGQNIVIIRDNPFESHPISDTLNIAEIQDEFIQIQLGNRFHLLSTSQRKKVRLWKSYQGKQSKMNVYNGNKLIDLRDEIDVLNYFTKYGFELMKSGTKSTVGLGFEVLPSSFVYFESSKNVLTFRKKD